MPSDAKKARDAAKKAAAKQGKGKSKKVEEKQDNCNGGEYAGNGTTNIEEEIDHAAMILKTIELENAQARSVAGTLTSDPKGLDHKVESLTVTFHGREIVVDTKLELNRGRRYGFIGLNGCGKSTVMQAIFNREMPIPESVDMYLVSREMPASEMTALQAVVDVDTERKRLEHLAEELAGMDDDESQEKLMDVYDRLDSMDAELAGKKAAEILHGLGFTKTMQMKKCKDFSGGWRMRIALARALFLKPSILLLDEPTNHLDLEACVWLEEELKNYKRTLLVVSHSQDFMNGVCTNIIHLFQKKLVYYTGNYDQFIKTRIELLENQMKRYNWEQSQLQHMKDYVARFGHGSAKLARQAQSKEKTMAKMIAGGLTEKAVSETVKQFYFFDAGEIPPPVIMVQHVSFRYNDNTPWIYKDIDFGIDLDTRIALVGPNGAGKSTLLKLLCGDVMPTDGLIRRHSHVKIGSVFLCSSSEMEDIKTAKSPSPSMHDQGKKIPPPNMKDRNSKSLSIRRSTTSLRISGVRNIKTTMLTFHPVAQRANMARVQLLLCNISDRELFVKLKCNPDSNVTAIPASTGHIAAKSQMRIVLTWNLPHGIKKWRDVAMPKMLLCTWFLKNERGSAEDIEPTKTRLMHLHEELPLEISALEFMMKSFPDVKEKEEMRKIVGRYGITGREQVCPMKQLSDGQRCRVSFAWLAWQQPHLLLLDEPTNHLDMESIDALAEAINCYSGGMFLVSHDFRLVSQVAEQVWVCDNQGITKWEGDIFTFKEHLRRQIEKDVKNREKGLTKER